MLSLTVVKRNSEEKSAGTLRREGSVPAVVYGAHHASTPIAVTAKEFDKVFKAAGESSVVALTGLGEEVPVLIHEVEFDPLTSRPRHVDFYAITRGEKVEVEIPLTFVGESPAVKGGANLVTVMRALPLKADPMNLPHDIEVDISVLAAVGDQVHVKDLNVPASAELMVGADEVVALIQEVKEEPVEETVPADLSSIEVETKAKDEAAPEEAASAEETKA